MNKIYKIQIKPALIIVSIMFFIVGFFSYNSISNYLHYKNTVNESLRLDSKIFHLFLRKELSSKLLAMESFVRVSFKSELPVFGFKIENNDIKDLNKGAPYNGFEEYVDTHLSTDAFEDDFSNTVGVRYVSGDNYHWLHPQKSIQVELESGDKFNLINPKLSTGTINTIGHNIASELGILSPDSFPAKVVINGEYMGVYNYVDITDESFLRNKKVMPGSIYFGDEINDEKKSILWQYPFNWDKKASRNSEMKDNRDDIDLFINTISNAGENEFYTFVNKYIDKEKLYKFTAIDTLLGDNHRNAYENHKWYFDPYKGKFEPVYLGIDDWSFSKKKDFSSYSLLKRVKLNPILEFERDAIAYNLLKESPISRSNLMEKLNHINSITYSDIANSKYRDESSHNTLLHNLYSVPFLMSEYRDNILSYDKIILDRHAHLDEIYNDNKISYFINGNNLIFEASGNSPTTIDFSDKHQVYKNNSLIETEIVYPGRKKISLTKNNDGYSLAPSELIYKFSFIGNPNELIANSTFTNSIIGKETTPTKVDKITPSEETISIHPWELPTYENSELILQGLVNINEDVVYDKYTSVTIKPGTRFLLAPDKSIFFYGKVTAIGTKENPITFSGSTDQPWGSVVVQGQDASGSTFDYVEFDNGSLTSKNLINYTAQFNIHDLEDFKVDHCRVGENFIGDDSMHIAYASGKVSSCLFHNARSDALDIDISDVTLSNNLFMNAGNDLLDLMTTTALIKESIFYNGGDKGISIGEWSNATVENTIIYGNLIGIEVKDKSIATLNNVIFIKNEQVGINLYNKIATYDKGGTVKGSNIYIVDSPDEITLDDKSSNEIDKIINKKPEVSNIDFIKQWFEIDKWNDFESNLENIK